MRVVCEGGAALIAIRVREGEGVEVAAGPAMEVVNGLRRVAVEQLMIAGRLVEAVREAGLVLVLGLIWMIGLLTFRM